MLASALIQSTSPLQMPLATTTKADNHTIPVIDRMMDVLSMLERHASGLGIRDMSSSLRLPRTTVYRFLNTLQRHEVVRRESSCLRTSRRT